jgi:hypothetical protein
MPILARANIRFMRPDQRILFIGVCGAGEREIEGCRGARLTPCASLPVHLLEATMYNASRRGL